MSGDTRVTWIARKLQQRVQTLEAENARLEAQLESLQNKWASRLHDDAQKRIRELKDERDIFKRTLDKRDERVRELEAALTDIEDLGHRGGYHRRGYALATIAQNTLKGGKPRPG